MPETAESLSFDESGGCSVCKQIEFKKEEIDWNQRHKDLIELVEEHRGKYDYDCIVPFSGGKDSTFTLYYLAKELKLKCLVVRFDHLFMRPTVEENCTKTFKKLGVDVIRFSPNWKVVRKLMYESLVRRGDFCWHCHTGIFAYPMHVSLMTKVPLIFWGEPGAEYSSYYSYDEVEEADERRFNLKINLGINAEDMHGMLDNTISDHEVTLRDLKPYTYPSRELLMKNKTRSVYLGAYIPWNPREQSALIAKELDWKGDFVEGVPPEYSYEKIECFMQGLRDYIKFLKRGFGRTSHLTSIDIRNGELTREKALELVKEYDGKRPKALDFFLDLMEIKEEEFYNIVSKHVVSPNKMPNTDLIGKNNKVPKDFDSFEKIFSHK
tara:strand:+ start:1142 stop:2281 length:1140 start_codon:yes stop_codon:yes gene_type:complete